MEGNKSSRRERGLLLFQFLLPYNPTRPVGADNDGVPIVEAEPPNFFAGIDGIFDNPGSVGERRGHCNQTLELCRPAPSGRPFGTLWHIARDDFIFSLLFPYLHILTSSLTQLTSIGYLDKNPSKWHNKFIPKGSCEYSGAP